MARGRRIANIGTGRIIAVLVLKHAVEHQKLFATAMRVRREAAGRCVPNHGRRSGHLITDAIEHAPVDARDRGGNPRKLGWMHRDPLREIGVQFHQSFVRRMTASMPR